MYICRYLTKKHNDYLVCICYKVKMFIKFANLLVKSKQLINMLILKLYDIDFKSNAY